MLRRKDPTEVKDPNTGKMVTVGGYLKTYNKAIDEDYIKDHHGGGTYELTFNRRGDDGKFKYFAHRVIVVAGDPLVDDLPRNAPPTGAVSTPVTAATGENPTIVNKALEMMNSQLERAQKVADQERNRGSSDSNPAVDMLVQTLQQQIAASHTELAEMRKQVTAMATTKPPEDPFRERLLDRLMADDSSRMGAQRDRYESEIRQLKDGFGQDERRLRDSFERDKAAMIAAHDRELSAVRQSNELAMSAIKMSFETQMKLLEGSQRTLERDNTELRLEVKELRAKKDKTIVEQAKDLQAVKEALGLDEEEASKGNLDKVMDMISNPAALDFAKGIMNRGQAAPATIQQAVQQTGKPMIVAQPNGQKFRLEADGKTLTPVKQRVAPKPKPVNPDGTPAIELPEISQETISLVVGMLERAFAGDQQPEVVAQSWRMNIPEDVLQALRDHGVDVFLTKVAKLPSTSPLSSLLGKNWVRKVSAELVGE